ncbi:uncharacterized protein LOC142350049 [Convolutriloba macropyga]|uniref:uncharacterized protein LOC142350049 n=1 Tax=Convolutriloba macropyga TaxID=536237 RepID=UPI003F51F105
MSRIILLIAKFSAFMLFVAQVESNCPSKCDCNPYSWDMNQIDLDCHRAQLDTIPRNVPLTTAKADFSLNKLGLDPGFQLKLDHLHDLRNLDLSANFLESTHIKDIPDSVEILDLSANSLSELSLDDLPTNIRELNLAKNGIDSINGCSGESSIQSSSQIAIRFDYNAIPILTRDTFGNCSASFGYIDLSSNNLHTVEHNAFRGVIQKANDSLVIDMSYNKLEIVPFEAFQDAIFDMRGFEYFSLDLRKNPLLCSCNMSWIPMMLDYFQKMGLKGVIMGTCYGPEESAGRHLEELTKAEFKSCTEYSWLKAEIKARTEQRIMPFWQVCLVVLACPGLVATVVLIVGVRMHVKDYRRYRDYVVRKKRQIATQRRRHHFRASGAVGDVLLNSSIKNSQK